MKFKELEISSKVKRAVEEIGFDETTPVQEATIPLIMEGRDVIGHSQTGTGKTAAFAIPAIEMIDIKNKAAQVLILCPTRELAVQSCEEIRKFAKYLFGIKSLPIYGGQPIDRQIRLLKQGVQIVIGTPGRVMDHMRRRTLKLDNLKMIVLDEADEMLNMGFREDIETILKDVPEKIQTVLFSATMSKEILNITKNYQVNPEHIKIAAKELTIPSIEQIYFEVKKGYKQEAVGFILNKYEPKRTIIFCNTKRQVDELIGELGAMGYLAGAIHGDMKQNTRMLVLSNFKNGSIDILVATDVAARGIDVDGIDAVINYDIPQDLEYYVHRIGRTGRAGKSGRSFTFAVGRRQLIEIREIQKFTKSKMKLEKIPSNDEIVQHNIDRFIDDVQKNLKKDDLQDYKSIVEILTQDYKADEVAAAMARMLLKKKVAIIKKSKVSERPSNKAKEKRRERKPGAGKEPMTTLRINIGKNSKISAGHILAAVAGDGDISGKDIGDIRVLEDRSTVEVPISLSEKILKNMKKSKIKGKNIKIEK